MYYGQGRLSIHTKIHLALLTKNVVRTLIKRVHYIDIQQNNVIQNAILLKRETFCQLYCH